MRFLDRESEMARLDCLAVDAHGGFAAVWGRRRIGKSALLIEWCRKHRGLYTVADRSLPPLQREAFAAAASVRFPGFADVAYPSWKSLFAALTLRAKAENWHGPVVMDEFPYWVQADETLPSVLQNWIDSEKARGGLVCAIAGSIQHMMQGFVLDADSPLYGRVDEKIKLGPISAHYMVEALGLKSSVEAVKAYAVWGGVPRYWVAAERFGAELDESVDELTLDPLGVFHDEPSSLLHSEIPNAIGLKPYLDIIGAGANRASEIAGRLGLPATALSKPLTRLADIGLVKREIPFGASEKDSKRSLYKVSDPFCKFWFRVLAARKSVFDNSTRNVRLSVWRNIKSGIFAETWEDMARGSVSVSRRLASLAGECGYWRPAGRWWRGNGPEWDVMSVNGSGERALLGEVKWSEKPFRDREIERLSGRLMSRAAPTGLPSECVRVLFLSSVAKGSEYARSCGGVEIVTADEVVSQKTK